MEFSRQEYWSELPFPSPGNLPNPGIKPKSPELQADSLPSDHQESLSVTPDLPDLGVTISSPISPSRNSLSDSHSNLPSLHLFFSLWQQGLPVLSNQQALWSMGLCHHPVPRVLHPTDILTPTLVLSLSSYNSHSRYCLFSKINNVSPCSCCVTKQAQLIPSEATGPSYYPAF